MCKLPYSLNQMLLLLSLSIQECRQIESNVCWCIDTLDYMHSLKYLKFDHVLGSCIVEMVHVVKVVNSGFTVQPPSVAASDHLESESGSRPW